MHPQTTLPGQSEAVADGIVEREVETVRTVEHVAALDGVAATEAGLAERRASYLATLPERLRDLDFVLRASILGLLGVRFLLRASDANRASDFGGFVEGLSWVFARPFANLFPSSSAGPGTIEFSTLIAMIVYALVFVLLRKLYTALSPRVGSGVRRRAVLWNPRQGSTSRPSEPRKSIDVDGGADHAQHRRYRMTRVRRI